MPLILQPQGGQYKARTGINSREDYEQMYNQSLSDPAAFWGKLAQEYHWQQKVACCPCTYTFLLHYGSIIQKWEQFCIQTECQFCSLHACRLQTPLATLLQAKKAPHVKLRQTVTWSWLCSLRSSMSNPTSTWMMARLKRSISKVVVPILPTIALTSMSKMDAVTSHASFGREMRRISHAC